MTEETEVGSEESEEINDFAKTESVNARIVRICSLACAAVVVKRPNGDESIATAFHVGDGVFLTARHVLDGNELLSITPHRGNWLFEHELTSKVETHGSLYGKVPIWSLTHQPITITKGPFFHKDPKMDVAAFAVEGLDPNTPALILGDHLDDWINDDSWLLTEAVVFGYPPVPTSSRPLLVAATVEVNGVVDTYRDRYVRFVVSGPPRGGFSGGPAYHKAGFALGMVIEGLEDVGRNEHGFFTVLSVESLYEVLDDHDIRPKAQEWPGFS